MDAEPPQVSFHWVLNNSLGAQPIRSFVSSDLRSVTSFTASNTDHGQLACVARNKVGKQSEPCFFQLIPASKPQPLRNCIVANETTDSLDVTCESGEDVGLKQTFHLWVYDPSHASLISNLTSNKPVFHVSDLPRKTPVALVIFASNTKGRSESLTLFASTLPHLNDGECEIV